MPRAQKPTSAPLYEQETPYRTISVYRDNERPRSRGCDRVYLSTDILFVALEVLADLRDVSARGIQRRDFAAVRVSARRLAELVKPRLSKNVNDQILWQRCRLALRIYAEATGDDAVRSSYLFASPA
jgi:hypothetical protein